MRPKPSDDRSRLVLRIEPRLRKALEESVSSAMRELVEIDDLLQDIFLHMLSRGELLEDEEEEEQLLRVLIYARGVRRNAFRSVFREKRHPRHVERIEDELRLGEILSSEADPFELASRSEMRAIVVEAIVRLPGPEDLIMLLAFAGFETREIAEALEVPMRAVRDKRNQAYERLRLWLKPIWEAGQ